mmetsp:Transcript_61987/g.119480  ORF Transcript_61987/g.119480 Transcript_61987/m.119480 type:complete len:82 (-) Transcript_61987:62-307(-)
MPMWRRYPRFTSVSLLHLKTVRERPHHLDKVTASHPNSMGCCVLVICSDTSFQTKQCFCRLSSNQCTAAFLAAASTTMDEL